MIEIEICECPRGHGVTALMLLDEDGSGSGTRLTGAKCCGSWRTVRKFPIDGRAMRALKEAIAADEARKEQP